MRLFSAKQLFYMYTIIPFLQTDLKAKSPLIFATSQV